MDRETSTRETYTVGRLAAELGVTTRTLRFYEEAGIVTPARTGSGAARSYDARDRARLVLALRGKRFGMSLAEIREIVDMYDAEPGESTVVDLIREMDVRVAARGSGGGFRRARWRLQWRHSFTCKA